MSEKVRSSRREEEKVGGKKEKRGRKKGENRQDGEGIVK